MKFEQFYIKEDLNYTQEMEDWFIKRTDFHISLVKKYAGLIEEYKPSLFKGLSDVANDHDSSKLNDDIEKIPYIFISWDYHCKDLKKPFEVPQDIRDKMNDASLHHIQNNKHHPEYWSDESDINKKDRDAIPDKIIDATKMPIMSIGESNSYEKSYQK